ncbi:MAG TPA: tRNA lysidine(34) synthetase TilS [Lentisphaeria bacterium]|nr:tRNA lysidine(34) synthetase TilS [Lentisphaerota bacterium]OQC16778.1 MAG: tRNA(Ile)-lysidine synthase [Lentisphaerae bacterium ADurb.Bin082]HPY89194.1 tRNA lysidine(34) synthetase TilS [Lentisphaeria bacterium]HQL86396.1 tRNA lysidine(34) synthetase TilS [Lentisphaeria bacterium]
MPLTNIIAEFLSANRIPEQVICGFSGGADSTALLLGLHAARPDVLAVHCHHGLRGKDADDDAEWCRQFCQQRGIRFQLFHLEVPSHRQPGESIEEAARRQRLETWQKLSDGNIPVFLGHHGDDALEDLFLKMARGANCSGLTGLRPYRNVAGVKLYRPLLAVRRQEIESYLLEQGVSDWRLDATNADNVFRRNAIRNHLLPLFRRIFDTDAGLEQCLRTLRQDADCLEAATDAQQPVTPADWQALPEALRVRLLQRLLPAEITVSHRTLTRLSNALQRFSGVPLTVSINHDLALQLTRDNVRIVRTDAALTAMPPRSWSWQTCPALILPELGGELQATVSMPGAAPAEARSRDVEVVAFAADSMPPALTVRTWQPGDRMTPFGATAAKKLQDIFTDAHIPRGERHRIPVVLAGDEIIWVAGVRRATWAPIRPETQRIVTLAWQRKEDVN